MVKALSVLLGSVLVIVVVTYGYIAESRSYHREQLEWQHLMEVYKNFQETGFRAWGTDEDRLIASRIRELPPGLRDEVLALKLLDLQRRLMSLEHGNE